MKTLLDLTSRQAERPLDAIEIEQPVETQLHQDKGIEINLDETLAHTLSSAEAFRSAEQLEPAIKVEAHDI